MTPKLTSLLAAALMVTLAGCVSDQEREWQVAADDRASADEIIEAGHAGTIATKKDQMVVTWEVRPEDDEGPYKSAWRLYDRDKERVADGTFGTVRESSARIEAFAVDEGFVLTDYVKHQHHFLDSEGRMLPLELEKAKLGTSLARGTLMDDERSVLLPNGRQVVRLGTFPTREPQAVKLTKDGTVWVLLPWTSNAGPFRIAYAKDGKAPWTTETIPLPKGSGTYGEGISAAGNRLFVVGSRGLAERQRVEVVLSREAGESETWQTIDTAGINGVLHMPPRIVVLPEGRLAALTSGEGGWIRKLDDSGFTRLDPPRAKKDSEPGLQKVGPWLWSSEETFGNALHYSFDYGKTWREFER